MRQLASMTAGLKMFWRKYIVRVGVLSYEDYHQGEVIEVQESTSRESVLSLRTELDKTNAQLYTHNEIIQQLKGELQSIRTTMMMESKTRMEHLEKN